jgi:serine/threonine protein kinase
MALAAGTKLGRYKIVSAIGSGGMGEVYRAEDTRLERAVAIKVLPAHLSQSPELRLRFEREAKILSTLSHSHICTLHDVGHEDGTDYVVMELLEGETLAHRLQRGPLPLEQVLRYGMEIAEALEAAHRQGWGIIHRDLKPGNIMLTKSGAKLLDFGLAKYTVQPAQQMAMSSEATVNDNRITDRDVIVGTFQYMAPEQIEGKEVDARTDIFAFGTVLYEMLTGQLGFSGKTRASLIAAIIGSEPQPATQLQPQTPPALDFLIRRCLAKDPDERWQTAHDVKLHLKWISEAGSQAGVPLPIVNRRKWRERVFWAVGLLLALLTAPLVYYLNRPELPPHVLSSLDFRDTIRLDRPGSFALSPDGKRLAYVASERGGKSMLWVRSLASSDGTALNGTEGASYPFWSPDSQHIGFFIPGRLQRVDAAGGPVENICAAPDGRGGSWSGRDQIVFAPNSVGGLWRVAASGGTPVQLDAKPTPADTFRWPQFLPDDDHVLFVNGAAAQGGASQHGIFVTSISSGVTKILSPAISAAQYSSGYLLFVRDGKLLAQPMNTRGMELTGEPVPLVEKIDFEALRYIAAASTSRNGLLLYSTDAGFNVQWTWFDIEGHPTGKLGEPGRFTHADVSPDGSRAVLVKADGNADSLDRSLWMYDAKRNAATRFTFGERSASEYGGVWSPDGQWFAFASNRTKPERLDMYVKPASGNGPDELLLKRDESTVPIHWSKNGYLAFVTESTNNKDDIWLLPMTTTGERKPYPVVQTSGNDGGPRFSADGRWLAYESDETGHPEIYITNLTTPGSRWQISSSGGIGANFCSDGKHLTYTSLDEKLLMVDLDVAGDQPHIGQAHTIFGGQDVGNFAGLTGMSDCKRVLAGVRSNTGNPRLTLISNWTARFKK